MVDGGWGAPANPARLGEDWRIDQQLGRQLGRLLGGLGQHLGPHLGRPVPSPESSLPCAGAAGEPGLCLNLHSEFGQC